MTAEPGHLTKEIAGIINGRMARYRITQAEMAEQVGVNQSHLSKMVRGLRPIDIDQLEIMAIVSGTNIDDVISEAWEAVTERGDWPDAEPLVLDGVRVSGTPQTEPDTLPASDLAELRKADVDMAAKSRPKK